MAITIEATYENGVFKPVRALHLREHQQVRITVEEPVDWVSRTPVALSRAPSMPWSNGRRWIPISNTISGENHDLCIGKLQILTITAAMVPTIAAIGQQVGLLTNDAAVVAIMQASGLT